MQLTTRHIPFICMATHPLSLCWLEPPRSQLGSESLKEHSCAHDLLLVMEALLSTRSSHWTVLLCLEKLLQKVLSFSSGPSSWQTDADTDHVVSKSARSQWRGHNWAECSFQSSQHPHTHTLIANILLPKFPRPPVTVCPLGPGCLWQEEQICDWKQQLFLWFLKFPLVRQNVQRFKIFFLLTMLLQYKTS